MEQFIKFDITSNVYFKIVLPGAQSKLNFCDDVDIFLYEKSKKYLLYSKDSLLWALRCFTSSLELAVQNKLQLKKEMIEDIGMTWNKELHATATSPKASSEYNLGWEDDYLVWSYKGLAFWMYNDKNRIFFKITPVYEWHFNTPEAGEHYIDFEEFIAKYTPTLVLEIDMSIAKEILTKTKSLLQSLEADL